MRAPTNCEPIYKFIVHNGGFATKEHIRQSLGLSESRVSNGLQMLRKKNLVISAGRGNWELTDNG